MKIKYTYKLLPLGEGQRFDVEDKRTEFEDWLSERGWEQTGDGEWIHEDDFDHYMMLNLYRRSSGLVRTMVSS